MHGSAGAFYGRTALRLGRRLTVAGHRFVSGITRGYDLGALLGPSAGGPILGGFLWDRYRYAG